MAWRGGSLAQRCRTSGQEVVKYCFYVGTTHLVSFECDSCRRPPADSILRDDADQSLERFHWLLSFQQLSDAGLGHTALDTTMDLSGLLATLSTSSTAPSTSSLDQALALALASLSSTSSTPLPTPTPPPSLDSDPYPSLLPLSSLPFAPPTALDWLTNSLPSSSLVAQALSILRSPSSDADIAESLLELWGYEGIEQVSEAVRRRQEIVTDATTPASTSASSPAVHPPASSSHHHAYHPHAPPVAPPRDHTPQAQVTFQTAADIAAAKKAKKALHKAARRAHGHEDGSEEVDFEEWERIRNESLAHGPGPLVSGDHVRERLRRELEASRSRADSRL